MRNNIDEFIDNMEKILSYDMIKYIINIIYNDENLKIIKKQKKLKWILNKDIINFHNTYYYDNNCMIYRNEYNQFILKNLALNQNNTFSLYSNNSTSNIILNNQDDNIILFNTNNNEYDDNGILIEKKITLNIMYI